MVFGNWIKNVSHRLKMVATGNLVDSTTLLVWYPYLVPLPGTAKGGNSLQKGKMACKIFYLSLTLHFLSETIRNIMITETVEV